MYIGKHVCEGVVGYFGVKIEYTEILKVYIIVYNLSIMCITGIPAPYVSRQIGRYRYRCFSVYAVYI